MKNRTTMISLGTKQKQAAEKQWRFMSGVVDFAEKKRETDQIEEQLTGQLLRTKIEEIELCRETFDCSFVLGRKFGLIP